MSLNTSQSRIWPRIFSAVGDGHRKDILLPQRTLSELNSPPGESESTETKNVTAERKPQTEAIHSKQVSPKPRTLPPETSQEPISYDERVISEALKDINSEIDTLQSLYNSQWFSDKRTISNRSKHPQNTIDSKYENTIKSHVVAHEAHSPNEANISISDINHSILQETWTSPKLLTRRKKGEDMTNFSSADAKPPKNLTLKTISDKKIYVASEVEPQTVKRPNALTDAERRAFKNAITATTKSEVSRETRAQRTSPQNATPAQISSTSHTQQQPEANELPSDTDVFINALTDVERQIFKDALYAMKAESEREESFIAKESSKSGLSRKATSLRSSKDSKKSQKPAGRPLSRPHSSNQILDDNRRNRVHAEVAKMVQTKSVLYKPPLVQRVSNIQTSKLRNTPEESQIRRGLTTTKKMAQLRTLQLTNSSKTSISNIRNGSFQTGFVKAVPLKAEVLEIKPSVPLITRHSAPKKVPAKAPSSNFRA